MIDLIDTYLESIGERSLMPTAEIRDLLLDLRLTFMVIDGQLEDIPGIIEPLA